jgi:glycosyltransferase involved in cell wall biosynthesis
MSKTSKKVLIDLKPALDGYSGIPQETRVLFKSLGKIKEYEISGLIQHGANVLKPGLKSNKRIVANKKINRLSRVIISLLKKNTPFQSELVNHWHANNLRWMALLRIPVQLTDFDGAMFQDFIWRTFFDKTLSIKDKKQIEQADFKIVRPSRATLHSTATVLKKFLKVAIYPIINTSSSDVFIAQNPYPGRVSKNTQLVVRYHDAVPVFMPHTISDSSAHQMTHFQALKDNVRSGAWFVCISESTKSDLLKIFPEVELRTVVIHNIVADEYHQDSSQKKIVLNIIPNRLAFWGAKDKRFKALSPLSYNTQYMPRDELFHSDEQFQYILIVSTIEPRKNHLNLLRAWERLKYSTMPELKLIVVGSLGWDCASVINAFRPWAEKGELFFLSNVPAYELRSLYKHAEATICPSFYEGFDYSGIEAMRCGCPVLASDIPVHREVYQNAAIYFDPYDIESIDTAIKELLSCESSEREAIKQELIVTGFKVSNKYTEKEILPKWTVFLKTMI